MEPKRQEFQGKWFRLSFQLIQKLQEFAAPVKQFLTSILLRFTVA
jgi:hypothetical protein